MNKAAVLSNDRRYRYELTRSWAPEKGRICWVMLNPSTAAEDFDDPTIRRCLRFTDGFLKGELIVVNLCAYRATNPRDLLDVDPTMAVGPDNGEYMYKALKTSDIVIAAWGCVAPALARWADYVVKLAKKEEIEFKCLGYNGDGSPKHPLYVAADRPLVPWPKPKEGGA